MSGVNEATVRASVATARSHLEHAAEQVVWQIANRVWTVLGYDSWDDMRAGEYGGAAVIVPRADRPELVTRLRQEGLSQQQIGDTLGVHDATVSRDLANADSRGAPTTIANARGQQRPTSYQRRQPSKYEVALALRRYPDLAMHGDDHRRILATAQALDSYDDDERAARLENLARYASAKREGRLPSPQAHDDVAERFFALVNSAAQLIDGKQDRFMRAADPALADVYADQFRRFAHTCEELATSLNPDNQRNLRSV